MRQTNIFDAILHTGIWVSASVAAVILKEPGIMAAPVIASGLVSGAIERWLS